MSGMNWPSQTVLVTGAAGFIGFPLANRLLRAGAGVVGLDNVNDYYDPALKQARLRQLAGEARFIFERGDICDGTAVNTVLARHQPRLVAHLAAQAGVRYSLVNPRAYVDANLVGFTNILEACRHHDVAHVVFASSSSVYGSNTRLPFSVHDPADHPVSLYAATKKANELMAHVYSHLFRLPLTGLRFFTVYGPLGPTRHGALHLYPGHPGRTTDPAIQPRTHATRLHVRRRRRRGHRARAGPTGDAAPRLVA